jgi:hypothetical protein
MMRRLLALAALALAAGCSRPVTVPSVARAPHAEEVMVAAERPATALAARPVSRPVEARESTDVVTEEIAGDGAIGGWVIWAEGPTDQVKLVLKGAPETPQAHLQWIARTDADGRFDFTGIPAGSYMLTNRVWGSPTWRLEVSVRAGERVSLDLSQTNATLVRDDFPDA